MTTYRAEAHKRYLRGQVISVVNLTPEFRWEERNAAKKIIEKQLYDVFYKYSSTSFCEEGS